METTRKTDGKLSSRAFPSFCADMAVNLKKGQRAGGSADLELCRARHSAPCPTSRLKHGHGGVEPSLNWLPRATPQVLRENKDGKKLVAGSPWRAEPSESTGSVSPKFSDNAINFIKKMKPDGAINSKSGTKQQQGDTGL
ncbi:RAD50-interacting protein 1 [Manis javanica]|nr:RAD50-interacting protein 1 [Manis javanica]